MDGRAERLHVAMTRIEFVIDRDPTLKARAAESRAFTRFVEDIQEFDRLYEVECAAKTSKPLLRQEMDALVRRIMLEVKCIADAYHLTGGQLDVLAEVKTPKESCAAQFTALVLGYADAMERYKDALIDVGLHPRKFEDVRALVAEYVATHAAWAQACLALENSPGAVKFWVERATRRGELLYGELYSAMSNETRKEWTRAASLGRTHRPLALPSGEQRALPAAGETADNPVQSSVDEGPAIRSDARMVENSSNDSFGRRTIRAFARLLPGSDAAAAAAEAPRPAAGEATPTSADDDASPNAGAHAA